MSVWPMEYIKTQLQLNKKAPGGTPPPYTGMVEGLRYTARTSGFLSLYRGLSVTLVGSIPKAGIRFGGNAYFKQLLADDRGKLNMASQFLAGLGAGAVEAVFAVTPLETIKTKVFHLLYFNFDRSLAVILSFYYSSYKPIRRCYLACVLSWPNAALEGCIKA